MPSTKKTAIVSQITSTISADGNFALVKFAETKHKALEELRRALRPTGAKLTVYKNTLLEKAVEEIAQASTEVAAFKEKAFPSKEKTALLTLAADFSTGLKAFFEFAKNNKSLGFKVGYLDKMHYDGKSLERIATLPSKPELVAKVLGSFKSPITRGVTAFKFPTTYFVQVLKAKVAQG